MSDNQDLRIAVLGVGIMGADHVDRITNKIGGARVTVVNDYSLARAEEIAALTPGARVVVDPFDAIAAEDVDAVVLATPGPTPEKPGPSLPQAGQTLPREKPPSPAPGSFPPHLPTHSAPAPCSQLNRLQTWTLS